MGGGTKGDDHEGIESRWDGHDKAHRSFVGCLAVKSEDLEKGGDPGRANDPSTS